MSIERTIQRVVDELIAAWNRRDGASFSQLFAEDADYVTGAGIRLAGRGRIHDALFAHPVVMAEADKVSIVTQSVKIVASDAAVVLCGWQMDPADASQSQESDARTGLVTMVMQRTADGWRIVALQNTDATP